MLPPPRASHSLLLPARPPPPALALLAVHDYKMPGGWHAQDFLLKGYFQGKRDAEQHMLERMPAGTWWLCGWRRRQPPLLAGQGELPTTSSPSNRRPTRACCCPVP